jgi:hypothetical protein
VRRDAGQGTTAPLQLAPLGSVKRKQHPSIASWTHKNTPHPVSTSTSLQIFIGENSLTLRSRDLRLTTKFAASASCAHRLPVSTHPTQDSALTVAIDKESLTTDCSASEL